MQDATNDEEIRKKTSGGVSRVQLNNYKSVLSGERAVENATLDSETVFRVAMSQPDFYSDSYYSDAVAKAIRQGKKIGLDFRGKDESGSETVLTFRRER